MSPPNTEPPNVHIPHAALYPEIDAHGAFFADARWLLPSIVLAVCGEMTDDGERQLGA